MQSTLRTVERKSVYAFRLTPAEWRQLLADGSFLSDPDNSIRPRRLMGVPVQIVPDHRFAVGGQSASWGW
jgi:hypothetical protein